MSQILSEQMREMSGKELCYGLAINCGNFILRPAGNDYEGTNQMSYVAAEYWEKFSNDENHPPRELMKR